MHTHGEVKQKCFLFSDVKKLTDLFSLAINSLYSLLLGHSESLSAVLEVKYKTFLL